MNELDKAKRETAKQLKIRLVGVGLVVVVVSLLLFFSSGGSPDKMPPIAGNVTENQDCLSQNNCIGMDDFRDELKKFETELEPRLAITVKDIWNSKQLGQISDYKDLALRAFSTGNYNSAFSQIKQAGDIASSLIEAAEQKFFFNYSEALMRFENNEFLRAQERINDALRYNLANVDAVKLKERIAVLPQILDLMTEVQVARTENNLIAEKSLLEKIVKLDPERIIEGQRLKLLANLISQQKFQQHISNGFAAINNRNLTVANVSLAKARRLFPTRSEIKLLHEEVKSLEQKLGLQHLLSNAESLAQGDKWGKALISFSRALKEDKNNLTAIEGVKISTIMVTALTETNNLLNRPERITSSEVRTFAKGLLENAESLKPYSPSLKKNLVRLKEIVIAAEIPVAVRLVSDNKTDIFLRNFGPLGRTHEKIIQLKPGKYYFEGRRKGFRSKTVTFHVPLTPSGTLAEVRIMLDE